MGFLARAFAEQKSGDLYSRWVELMNLGAKSKAGPSINLAQAFRVSASLACMRVIAQGCAQVPFKLFQDYQEGGLDRKKVARDHAIYDVVTAKPNSWQTSFEFRETLLLHACMGNAFVFKNFYRGKLAEMILLDPGKVRAEQNEDDWSITYKVRGSGGVEKEIPASLIWHVRGPSWDGFLGMDTLKISREALGLSIALEESHAGLHSNGVRPTGVYSIEGTLNDEQQKKLSAWLKREAAAPGAPMVLDRNAKWLTTAMTGVDAQHVQTRDKQIEEVCRFFGVLPIMIGHTGDKASTYASAEAMFTAHKIHTLAPWYTRIQESADINLLTDAERKDGYYFKFVANALLWASAKDLGDFFSKMLGSGGTRQILTQDEIRALLEFDPMGGDAAKLLPPMNSPAPADPAAQKRFEALESKFAELKTPPTAPVINVNLNQEPVHLSVEPGPVTVNVPAAEKSAAPVVNVQNDIHVPQGAAPTVNNTVNVPEQPAPVVKVDNTLPELTVIAQMPARKTTSETNITRDKDGNIIQSRTQGTEKDA